MNRNPFFQGARAINVLRLASAGAGGQTVTIGDDVYELTTRNDLAVTAGRIPVDVHGGSTVKSQGKLTFSGAGPSDEDTVTIGGKVYTFLEELDDADGSVLIGEDNEETIDNLVAAINGGAGRGTGYGLATVTHTTVTAAKNSTDKVIITAIAGGTAGDAITLAEDADNVAKDAATLGTTTAGVDPTATEVGTALTAAINNRATERVEATKISANEVLVFAKTAQVLELACAETLTGTNNAWASATMYGGSVSRSRRIYKATRVPTAVEVALGNMHFKLPFTPTFAEVKVHISATPGILKDWDGAVTIAGDRVTVGNGGSTDWAQTDTLEVLFLE